ncbi:hypothetical protein FNCP11_05040 [Fusobacterium nucleatum]|nr:hypothetical protein FNCP11_05040 [Fusobacterium nucleatum]BEP09580.1 hypothetical protein FNSP11_04240 [Fusobacterium nucleatum]
MEHITNVLVYSNRCEVLDSHVFTVGDRGFPHIRLKFIYMFGAETLQGKQLELKYILPDRSYQVEKIVVSGKDEALFPIHYSVFVNGGWTTLKVTIIEGANRISLDDIIIKTKKLDVGQEFQHKEVKAIVQAEISKRTEEIKAAAEETKTKLTKDLETIYQEKVKTLDQEIETSVSTHFDEKANEFNTKIDNAKIKNLSYADNKLKITLNDNTEKETTIKSGLSLRKVDGEYTISQVSTSANIQIGNDWKIIFLTYIQFSQELKVYFFKKENTSNYKIGQQFEGGITVKINNGELSAESNQPLTIKDIWVME